MGALLTVASFNVNFARVGDPSTLRAIAESRADALFLQETSAAWEAALGPALAGDYPHRRFDHCPRAGGLAVLSRVPFAHGALLPPVEGAWWPAWWGVLEAPLGPVRVLHLHLRPSMDDRGRVGVRAFWRSRAVRRREAEARLGALAPGLPTLVVGDLNESRLGAAVAALGARGLRSCVRPWQATWRWGVWRGQLDHVLYDGARLALVRARVPRVGGSDHLPVLATFARAEPRAARPPPGRGEGARSVEIPGEMGRRVG